MDGVSSLNEGTLRNVHFCNCCVAMCSATCHMQMCWSREAWIHASHLWPCIWLILALAWQENIYFKTLTRWNWNQARGVFSCFEGVVVDIVVGNAEVLEVEPQDYSTKSSGWPPANGVSISYFIFSSFHSTALLCSSMHCYDVLDIIPLSITYGRRDKRWPISGKKLDVASKTEGDSNPSLCFPISLIPLCALSDISFVIS